MRKIVFRKYDFILFKPENVRSGQSADASRAQNVSNRIKCIKQHILERGFLF